MPSNDEYQFYDNREELGPHPCYRSLSIFILSMGSKYAKIQNPSAEECHRILTEIPLLANRVTSKVLQFFLSLPFFAHFPKINSDKENPNPRIHKPDHPFTGENEDPFTGDENQSRGQSGMNQSTFSHLGLDSVNPNIPQQGKFWNSFDKPPVDIIPICRIPKIETTLQKYDYYFCGVFKIKTKYVQEYLLEEVDAEDICLKIYPQYNPDKRDTARMYKNEVESIKILSGVEEYNNIYLSHREFTAQAGGDSGKAILSKFIDNKLQLNEELIIRPNTNYK